MGSGPELPCHFLSYVTEISGKIPIMGSATSCRVAPRVKLDATGLCYALVPGMSAEGAGHALRGELCCAALQASALTCGGC